MKIIDVETVACTHGTSRDRMSFLFVEIAANDGTVGWGEACDSYGSGVGHPGHRRRAGTTMGITGRFVGDR